MTMPPLKWKKRRSGTLDLLDHDYYSSASVMPFGGEDGGPWSVEATALTRYDHPELDATSDGHASEDAASKAGVAMVEAHYAEHGSKVTWEPEAPADPAASHAWFRQRNRLRAVDGHQPVIAWVPGSPGSLVSFCSKDGCTYERWHGAEIIPVDYVVTGFGKHLVEADQPPKQTVPHGVWEAVDCLPVHRPGRRNPNGPPTTAKWEGFTKALLAFDSGQWVRMAAASGSVSSVESWAKRLNIALERVAYRTSVDSVTGGFVYVLRGEAAG